MEFKQYPSYKNSGVEWLGDVPSHWDVKKIKRLSPVKRGASPRPINDLKYFDDNGEYAWVRISDVTRCNGYLFDTEQKLSELGASHSVKLEPESMFLSIAATVGKPCITKIKTCIHDGFVYFPKLKKHKELLFNIFDSKLCFVGLGKLGTQLNLNSETVEDIYISIPPDSEEEKVIKFLSLETTKIDTLIAKQEKLIELLEEQRKSIISHAVTKGLDPNVPMKDSGVEWLGNVPEHWNISKLRYYLDGIKDGTHGTHVSTTEGELLLSGKNIKNGKLVINDNERKISLEDHQKITANGFPKKGDLLINVVGTIGQSCIYELDTPISFQRSVCFLRANNKLEPNFLQRILESNLSQNQLKILTNKSTIGGVYMGDLVELIIPVVPIKEQNKITDYLDKEIQEIVNCIDKQKLLIEKLKEYRASVISHAVTGKIDIRELVA